MLIFQGVTMENYGKYVEYHSHSHAQHSTAAMYFLESASCGLPALNSAQPVERTWEWWLSRPIRPIRKQQTMKKKIYIYIAGWCLTPTLLLICSSFSRENGNIFLICSSLSTAQIGVSKNRGTLNGWFIMVPNPIKMDDLGGTIIFGHTHIWKWHSKHCFRSGEDQPFWCFLVII